MVDEEHGLDINSPRHCSTELAHHYIHRMNLSSSNGIHSQYGLSSLMTTTCGVHTPINSFHQCAGDTTVSFRLINSSFETSRFSKPETSETESDHAFLEMPSSSSSSWLAWALMTAPLPPSTPMEWCDVFSSRGQITCAIPLLGLACHQQATYLPTYLLYPVVPRYPLLVRYLTFSPRYTHRTRSRLLPGLLQYLLRTAPDKKTNKLGTSGRV